MLRDTREFLYHISQILPLFTAAQQRSYRLILLTGGGWRERTVVLKGTPSAFSLAYVPLGLGLSQALMSISTKDRPLILAEQVSALLPIDPNQGVALDHIEILFTPDLRTDPLRFLQSLSISHLILASWPGHYDGRQLTYAEPSHLEFYNTTDTDFLYYSL